MTTATAPTRQAARGAVRTLVPSPRPRQRRHSSEDSRYFCTSITRISPTPFSHLLHSLVSHTPFSHLLHSFVRHTRLSSARYLHGRVSPTAFSHNAHCRYLHSRVSPTAFSHNDHCRCLHSRSVRVANGRELVFIIFLVITVIMEMVIMIRVMIKGW